jgi:hypothetical protein
MHPPLCHLPLNVSLVFVKLYDECYLVYIKCLVRHFPLQSYVNMVFRHDWRPPSFNFIYLAIMLHWLVYKHSDAPYLSYMMKSC